MIYGYVRVSSITQNIDRQMEELKKYKIPFENIYIDKQSGKDFNRENYQILKEKIKKGDLLIIKSIDRLGRNYKMILDEWYHITKVVECDVLVIDMPLLDTRTTPQNLVGRFIADIVLQILSFVAETERDNIKQRQAEGIAIAKAKGVHMGRPKLTLPENFTQVIQLYMNKQIKSCEAAELLNMPISTFFKYLNIEKQKLVS
ncbi:MAG: recombinase family protein [Candidatus Caccovivens sp.]